MSQETEGSRSAMQMLVDLSHAPHAGEKLHPDRIRAICAVGHDRVAFVSSLDAPVTPAGGEVAVFDGWIDGCPEMVEVVHAEHHRAHVARLQAENAALQQRLNEADQRVDDATDLLQRAQQLIPELQYNWHANTKALLDSMNPKQ